MNIAIVIPGFSDGERDWCIPVYLNLVRKLADHDRVHVFAIRYPPRHDTFPVYGATVHTIGGRYDTAGIGRLHLWRRTLAAIRHEHRREPFDLIHAIWADECGFIANLAGRLLGVPTIVSIAGGELVGLSDIGYGLGRGRRSRWIVAMALRGADRVIAPSEYVAEAARRLVPRDRLIVSPLGVDTQLFAPAEPPQMGKRLLAVGSLTPIKDHAALLRAFAKLRTPDVTLEIAGEGYLEGALRAQIKTLGIADRVRIRGIVTHDELPAVYQAADLHILTSRHEAFGMVVIEAAACGVPTIGYARGIVPELAARGAAISIYPGDETALAAAIDELLNDPDQLAKMRKAAQNAVAERFTLDTMTRSIYSTYKAIIPEKARFVHR